MPSLYIKYIQNEQHYTEIISWVATVKQSLWIGTADIKDLYVMKGTNPDALKGKQLSKNGRFFGRWVK